MSTIAIIGPGAIGGTVAVWLGQDKNNQISLCVRTSFDELKVETPYGVLSLKADVYTSPEQVSAVDWVLIATKAYDAAATAQWLPRLLGPHTVVAVLQNGVEHITRFAPYVPAEQLLPVVVNLPAARKAAGHIWQRRDGALTVPDDAKGRAFVRLFEHTKLTANTAPDFLSAAWTKLVLNGTGALPALLLKPIDVNRNEELIPVLRSLIRECIAVGKAEGAVLDDELEERIISGYIQHPSSGINSLHADRLAGRPMETDARNGAVVRLGKKHGIPTPVNELIVALLCAV